MTEDSNSDDDLQDRECPECNGTCYDDDDTPCQMCWGEGVLLS